MTSRTRRRGFTLVEILVVLAVLLILGLAILPTIQAYRGDTRPQAAADSIRGELAAARSRAMEEGRPYRVAISTDGTRVRRAPDDTNFEQAAVANVAGAASPAVDYQLDFVKVVRIADQNIQPPDAVNGWVTLASVQPDGTCTDDTALVSITETTADTPTGNPPMLYVRVRGLTSSSRVVPNNTVNGNGGTR